MFSKDQVKELKQLFWQKLENRTKRLPGQKGHKKKWIFENTGIKGLDLRFDVDRQRAMVALEINHRNEDRRLHLYEKLEACKTIFEREYGMALKWDYLYTRPSSNDKEVCRVYNEMPCDMYQQDQWPEVMHFLIDQMLRMEKAFLEVKDFLEHDELGQ